ncbi:hypothetical protein CF392_04750 [Tamilnaduibacter salinus]|uniref:Porin n=1 Tax=Tamilnaduibacter salinus TaxID=1484056 RepID=A0A2A2I5W8_9GAMM|nr:DcaP family trimeric outer membrane transporter [Tamilnaduibacter salinus]PAV26520.1 hypothetical protein CF392_04750 [Tamilnaduibacter salinus]
MKTNKMTLAVRATTASLLMGVAGQAAAFEFQAGDVNADVYGYARMNAVYDIDQDIGLTTQSGNFTNVDPADAGATGIFDADAQQSRLGVTATHANGVKINLETDFRGGTFRIRHAYGEYENLLIGRTWSNFNSFVGFTSTLDFDSLAGNAGVQDRAAQVRYTSGPLSFSLEDPRFQRIAQATGTAGALEVDGTNQTQSLPVATVRFQQGVTDALTVSAAGLVQQLSLDGGNGAIDETAVGFGAFAAARLAVNEMLSVQGAFNYTNGANGYLYRSGNGGFGAADAYLDGNGSLETLPGYGGTIGVGADIGMGTVNAGYGLVTVDWDDAAEDFNAGAVAARHETNSNVFVNYQWTPVEHVMMGVEYGYFDVEEYDGASGDANRIMFAAQYNF